MLSKKNIPMFGAVVTSSKLTGDGLVRVAPTNQDEAAALAAHIRTTPKWTAAILRLTATGATSLVQLSSSQGRPVGAS